MYSLLTGKRHLCIALRASEMRHCGCLGWCTVYPVMLWLRWSFQAMAEAKWPDSRHDGLSFAAQDAEVRQAMASKPLIKATLVHILGDWAEIAHTWGFPDWSHVIHPCFCCFAVRDDLFLLGNMSVITDPFPSKTHADYQKACQLCEMHVVIANSVVLARLIGFWALHPAGTLRKHHSQSCHWRRAIDCHPHWHCQIATLGNLGQSALSQLG